VIPIKEGRLRSVYAMEREDNEIPEGSLVVGINGQFEVSTSSIFNFIKPVSKDSPLGLKHITPGLTIKKKIPWNDFWVGAQWLRNQWDNHCAGKNKNASKEFILLLFYNQEEDKYFWYPPKQRGYTANLDYTTSGDQDIVDLVSGGSLIVGTMHNHFGKGTAFQSGTDHKDECSHGIPMIHLTMAYMDAPNIYMSEFDVRFVSGNEFNQKLGFHDIVEGIQEISTPKEWDSKLTVEYKKPAPIYPTGSIVMGRKTQKTGGIYDLTDEYESNDDLLYEKFRSQYYGDYSDFTVGENYPSQVHEFKHEEMEDLVFTQKVIESGPSGPKVASLGKKFDNVLRLAEGSKLLFCKAIVDALFQDLKCMIMTDSGVTVESLDDPNVLDIMTEVMSAVSRADDLLDAFVRKQNELCSKKNNK
jgi:hypothetical protein